MKEDNSALKLFIKKTPEALKNLFDGCISTYDLCEQIIFFDFFLFCPPQNINTDGMAVNESDSYAQDFVLCKMLTSAGKEYYLDHPLFYALVIVSKIYFHYYKNYLIHFLKVQE